MYLSSIVFLFEFNFFEKYYWQVFLKSTKNLESKAQLKMIILLLTLNECAFLFPDMPIDVVTCKQWIHRKCILGVVFAIKT